MNGMARAGLPMCIQLAHIFPQNYISVMVSQILLLGRQVKELNSEVVWKGSMATEHRK